MAVQVEIDPRLVVRHLQLEAQGLPESYGELPGDADATCVPKAEPSLALARPH